MKWIIHLGVLALFVSSCYTLEQAYHFNNAFNSRVEVKGALAAKDLRPELRQKLELSQKVLDFASENGLNTGSAYQHFIPEASSQVSYLVQAAPADKLEPVTWWFPIVGRVPYLGYFEKERRDRKAEALQKQGFDVSLGSVGAFSSLGWYEDPIYISMTRRSDEEFIQMILHELVHRSFWSKGSVPFNENLAEFVSQKMTEQFLEQERDGQGIELMRAKRADQEKLKIWLEEMKAELNKVYAEKSLTKEQKIINKLKIIRRFQNERFPELELESYSYWKVKDWNNASLLGASLYSPDFRLFENAIQCIGNFQAGLFLNRLKTEEKKSKSAEEALGQICQSETRAIGH